MKLDRETVTPDLTREFLSPHAAAKRLGVSLSAVRGYRRRGLLHAYRIRGSRLIRFKGTDVDALFEPLKREAPSNQ